MSRHEKAEFMTNGSEAMAERQDSGDSGAALLLALVFIIAIAIVFLALGNSVTGGLLTSRSLGNQRASEFAADAATTTAVQTVRYSGNTFALTGNCLGPLAGPIPVAGYNMYVDCSRSSFDPISGLTRVINFYACTSAESCGATNSIVQATVTFDDYSVNNAYKCTYSADVSTCGTAQTINSWIVETGNH